MSVKSIGAVERGEAVVIRDVTQTDRLQYPEEAKKEGIGSIVSIPIFFKGLNIGALRLYHYEPWDISENDIDSLLLLGENIGLAMTYTRILNALQAIKDTFDDMHTIWLTRKRE